MGDPKLDGVMITEKDLNLLYEITASIHQIEDLEEMLESVLQKIRSVFGIEGASVALHDPERKEFCFIRTAERPAEDIRETMQRMRFPEDRGIGGWVFRQNQTVLIEDVSKDSRFFDLMDRETRFRTRSMICLPLKTRKGPIGVLYALNKHEGEFTFKEARLLEIVSGPIAVAIENARFYGELKRQTDLIEKENIRLKSHVRGQYAQSGIIGSSPAMRRVFGLLEKVVDTDTAVLIEGETGTGKELIARVIHYNGPLRDRPFIAENCAAISEHLLESELFGHVKGAFTGAIADKKGIFEMASGGTVFLDEIADMPVSMQVKLLRVLQEGQVRPVGGSHYNKVKFRLIASTNQDLLGAVGNGRFRADLFYRIQVFPIVLPPLRERREDIAALATHFLETYAKRFERPVPRLTPEALEMLIAFDWPGNVRELENEMERAVCLADKGTRIDPSYLSERIKGTRPECTPDLPEGLTIPQAVEQIERRMIGDALRHTSGNRSEAARRLGLTRQGLLNKIGRYGIDL
ncbi:MAG: sigma 54-interacting transcriptional regulator [Desulfobacterales bacterium]